jgi:hypothetical protein
VAMVYRVPCHCLLVFHRCMVVPTVTFTTVCYTSQFFNTVALPRIKQVKIKYTRQLMFRSKGGVANFPYHPPAQVQDILLRKVE